MNRAEQLAIEKLQTENPGYKVTIDRYGGAVLTPENPLVNTARLSREIGERSVEQVLGQTQQGYGDLKDLL
jgi:hypothetical protein